MKNLMMMVLMTVSGSIFGQQEVSLLQTGAKVEFDKEIHDYGTIKKGADGECVFIIKNTGTEALIIRNAKGSCTCTVPVWPKGPIAPGKTAEIKVKYNTSRVGVINKSVTITSNANNSPSKVLRIKGMVTE